MVLIHVLKIIYHMDAIVNFGKGEVVFIFKSSLTSYYRVN